MKELERKETKERKGKSERGEKKKERRRKERTEKKTRKVEEITGNREGNNRTQTTGIFPRGRQKEGGERWAATVELKYQDTKHATMFARSLDRNGLGPSRCRRAGPRTRQGRGCPTRRLLYLGLILPVLSDLAFSPAGLNLSLSLPYV